MKNNRRKLGWKRLSLCTLILMLCIPIYAQRPRPMEVTGRVIDAAGESMIGVSILEKGTTNGVVTDLEGNYSLRVRRGATLVFSYVGYITQELQVTGRALNVTMKEDAETLDEVVVIGYGTTKAKNFTGSVDVVKMTDSPIADMGLNSASDMLRSRLSGVVMGAESGTVGSSSSILIRGRKSINATSEEPLIILDGVIFSGALDDIDPSSIETVSVLKDATSLAAYGSRAAQGVVMVTTKKGERGRPRINFSTSHEFSTPTYNPTYLDGAGYIRYRNAKTNQENLNNTSWMSFIERKNYEAGKETDWYDLVTRTGYTQNYSLNFSGATDNVNYYIGGRHSDQRGMVVGNGFVRNNLTINVSTKLTSWIELGANINYTDTKDDETPASVDDARQTPYGDAYLPDGRWRYYVEGGDATAINPVWNTYNGVDKENKYSNMVMGGFFKIDVPWVEGLSYRMNLSYTKNNSKQKAFTHESNKPAMLTDDWDGLGYSSEYYNLATANGSIRSSENTNWVIDNIISYTRSFGEHYVSSSLVYTRDYSRTIGEYYYGSDFTNAGNTLLGWYGLGNATNKNFDSPTYTMHTDIGYLARLIYSYKDTYHFNASFRRDGSSVFGNDNKWGNFPAFGAAWTISNEKWMENLKWIDNLKLKISWGKNGAQTLAPYGTLTTVSMGDSGGIADYYGGKIHYGQSITALGNPLLGWQTTSAWNGGFETDLFGNKLHFEMNVYHSKTTDQIFDRTIPIMTAGISTQKATMGQVNNTGVEINATSTNIKTKDFTWTSTFVFTLNRNKLVELYGNGQNDITNSLFVGKSLGAIYGYRTDGIFQEGEYAGTPIFLTKDGEQTANPSPDEDRTILGYSLENFRASLSNTLRYKGFQLYFMLNGVFGGNGYGLADNTFAYMTYNTQNRSNALDIPFWTKDNPSNKYPSPSYSNTQNFYKVYNPYTYIRLQELSLSYDLTPWVSKIGFQNARISLSGRNLFFIAPKWERSDPEARSTGFTYATIGLPKAFTMTLNFTY